MGNLLWGTDAISQNEQCGGSGPGDKKAVPHGTAAMLPKGYLLYHVPLLARGKAWSNLLPRGDRSRRAMFSQHALLNHNPLEHVINPFYAGMHVFCL